MFTFFVKLLKKMTKYVKILLTEKNFCKNNKNGNEKIKKNEVRKTKILEKGYGIMCKASEVGKIVINKCIDLNLSIDVQKLQKLLVLMQVECIKLSGKPLFKEDVRIWNCGVAIKEVDEDFRFNENAFQNRHLVYINLLDAEEIAVSNIINQYGQMDAAQLNSLPVAVRVINLGVKKEGDTVKHVSYFILIEEFSNKCA